MSLLYKNSNEIIYKVEITQEKGNVNLLFSADCGKFGTQEYLSEFDFTAKQLLEIFKKSELNQTNNLEKMNAKKILCEIYSQNEGEKITHIDQIKTRTLSGRQLFNICDRFSLLTMEYYYKKDLRTTRLLYFLIGFGVAYFLSKFI